MPSSAWPPPEGEFYRPSSLATPVWQGDLFTAVPIIKAPAPVGGGFRDNPRPFVERRAVMIAAYPCDLFLPGTATLSGVVAVVPLVDVTRRGAGIWKGHYDLCPLPGTPLGDDRAYAAALTVPTTVDSRYLTGANRAQALSIVGQAFLQQRLVTATTRLTTPAEFHEQQLAPLDHERWLQEGWAESGADAGSCVAWLDAPSPAAGGFPPRRWLESGQYAFVDAAAREQLRAMGHAPCF